MSQKELDAIADKVLAYDPTAKKRPLEVIAGAADTPLVIGDIEIPCFVLEDETRVLTQGGFLTAIGRSRTPRAGTGGVDNLPAFLTPKNLKPYISNDLVVSTTPIQFKGQNMTSAVGYKAEILPQVCEVYLKARDAGVLLPSQEHIAKRADIIIRGLATVGIIALVDEATGYQKIREENALAKIFEAYIAEELQPWTLTFPIKFYEEICRLRGWDNILSVRRPSLVGRITNDVVYERLAPGVLDELREKNPVLPEGYRRDRHHQWLTPDLGHPQLSRHLEGVMALMRASTSWHVFERHLEKAYPKPGKPERKEPPSVMDEIFKM